MLEFLAGNVVTIDEVDLTVPSRSIRLCAFDDGLQGGYTALHWAAANGHADCVELLLKHMDRKGVQLKDKVRNLKRYLSLSFVLDTRKNNNNGLVGRRTRQFSSFFFSTRRTFSTVFDSIFCSIL